MMQKPFIKEKIRENRLIFNFPSRTATIASNMLRCTYILRLKPLSHLNFNQIIEKNLFPAQSPTSEEKWSKGKFETNKAGPEGGIETIKLLRKINT